MKMKKIDIREIEGFRLGTVEDAEAGTGVTVIISEEGATAGVDVRGGAPATRETDLLRSENTVDKINAVVLSGGSAFGLESGSGVMRALAERGIGYNAGEGIYVPIVPGASLYDLPVGRSDVYPDVDMGRRAVENAFEGIFESGNHGAGTGASVGKWMGMDRAMKTGLGTFACGDDYVQVGAVAAVNAVGDVYNGAGNIIAGLRTSDGTDIKGTIRVLKGMVHEESASDLDMSDVKTMAVAEALQRLTKVQRSDETPRSESSEPASADEKSDIVKAMMESYEQGTSAAADQDAEGAPDPQEITAEEPVTADETSAASDAYLDLTEPSQDAGDDSHQDDADEHSQDAGEYTFTEGQEPAPEVTVYTETEIPAETYQDDQAGQESAPEEDDEYVLSEEDKADMGYDIPFNTTISCLITNAALTKSQANKLASILHDAYARAIKPVHGTMDGDTIFVMSTCTQEVNFDAFAALATDVMQYAIIDAAVSAEGAYGLPAARDIIHK